MLHGKKLKLGMYVVWLFNDPPRHNAPIIIYGWSTRFGNYNKVILYSGSFSYYKC